VEGFPRFVAGAIEFLQSKSAGRRSNSSRLGRRWAACQLPSGLQHITLFVGRSSVLIRLGAFQCHGAVADRAQQLDCFRYATAGFTTSILDGYGLPCPSPTRPTPLASDPVLVHRPVSLLHASFRTPPRGDALALRYPSPPSGWDGTCTRKLSNMHGVQIKRAARRRPVSLSWKLVAHFSLPPPARPLPAWGWLLGHHFRLPYQALPAE
jgi:hypothetical protein